MHPTPFRINSLLCEYSPNPLGIDRTTPRLSWRMDTGRPAARRTAYRITAASSLERLRAGDGDLWDGGKVESDQSVHVPYAGKTRSRHSSGCTGR